MRNNFQVDTYKFSRMVQHLNAVSASLQIKIEVTVPGGKENFSLVCHHPTISELLYLFHAWLILVVERPSLNMLWDQFVSNFRDFFPRT